MTNPNANSHNGGAGASIGHGEKDRREAFKDSHGAREATIPMVPRGWSSEKIEDFKTKLTKLVLMFRTVSGERRNLSIPAGEREDLKKVRRKLLDYDANLPGKESDDLLLIQHLINTVPPIPLSEVDKPGFTHTGKGFVLGVSLLGDANGGYWWHEDPNPMSVGAKHGTSKRWDEAAALLAHSSFATLALLTVLASPIARYIELRSTLKRPRGQVISETATFNFVGPSAAGKTLAVAVAASATGNPGNRSKWDFTRRGLEEYLDSRNEIGAIFDDVEKHIGEHLTLEKAVAIVTQYVPEGRPKEISNTVKAQGLDRKSWSTFALSSSPKPIADLVKGRTLGNKVRLMDIILPSRNSGGIIDYPPPNVDPLMFAKNTVQALENLIALNYGHLFPAWISLLLSTDFSDELIQLRDKFVEGVHADKSGYELRFARKFGILYAVGKVAVKNGLLEWPKDWPSTAISKCYGNALRASRRDEKRVENAIAKLQQAVTNRRFIPVVHRNRVPKIEDSHYGAICSYKGEKTVAVLDDALDLISGDKLVTKAFISRLKKTGVYRGGQGHAGTTQIAVPMRINGKQIEKPRFWLFNHARLMAFGTTTSRAQSSKPHVAPNRMRDASAKPAARLRKGRVGSR